MIYAHLMSSSTLTKLPSGKISLRGRLGNGRGYLAPLLGGLLITTMWVTDGSSQLDLSHVISGLGSWSTQRSLSNEEEF